MAATANTTMSMTLNGTTDHNMPPSRVLHCRAVCEGCREQDLIEVMQRFGKVTGIRLMPAKFQALVEFETLHSAMACVSASKFQPLVIRDRVMYVNYSKSSEISRKFNDSSKGQQPTHILLMTVINVIHPVTVETIKLICEQQNVQVQRIVFFHKNGLQVLAEFRSIMDATHIQKVLNGCDIYPGCCTLKVEFSSSSKLNVYSNTEESYNIDILEGGGEYRSGYPGEQQHYNNEGGHTNSAPFGLFDKWEFSDSNNYNTPHQGGWDNPVGGGGGGGMQANYLDEYASPFSDGGGEGCVAFVHGINNDIVNCNHLFNLFCLYGNVVKIKIIVSKPGCAMVQYASKLSTEMAIQNLNGLTLFGKRFEVAFSKHLSINEYRQNTCFDGSPDTVDFQESHNNRFKPVAGGRNDLFSMVHAPTVVLHYFNAPADCDKERFENLFETHSAEVPLKQLAIKKKSNRSTSGLLEFSSISKAVEALILVNHVILYKEEGQKKSPFTFKLAFSTSQTINVGR